MAGAERLTKKRIDTMDSEQLSRPENHVHRSQGMSLVDKVKACGGCYCCTRRDQKTEGWGRAVCGKVIPAQFLKPGCTFEPDYDRIYDRGNIE